MVRLAYFKGSRAIFSSILNAQNFGYFVLITYLVDPLLVSSSFRPPYMKFNYYFNPKYWLLLLNIEVSPHNSRNLIGKPDFS